MPDPWTSAEIEARLRVYSWSAELGEKMPRQAVADLRDALARIAELEAQVAGVRAEALEEAAQECESLIYRINEEIVPARLAKNMVLDEAAGVIRALAGREANDGG